MKKKNKELIVSNGITYEVVDQNNTDHGQSPCGKLLREVKIKKPKLNVETTDRGFNYTKFKDQYGVECSIQESSLAGEACIWLGSNKIGLKKFTPYKGWEDISTEPDPSGVMYVANNRMHLNQEQVKALLPLLRKFAKTGNL